MRTTPRKKIRTICHAIQAARLVLTLTVTGVAGERCFIKTLVFSAMLLVTPFAFTQEQVPAPAFKNGDSWQFKVIEDVANLSSTKELDGIYELVHEGGTVKGFQLTGDQKLEVAHSPETKSIVKASQQSNEGSNREIELIKTGSEAERR